MIEALVAFIEVRLAEDERVARTAADVHPHISTDGLWEPGDDGVAHAEGRVVFEGAGYGSTHLEDELAEHIARHDPARALRDVGSKRSVLHLWADAGSTRFDLPEHVFDGRDADERERDDAVASALDSVVYLLALP